MQLIATSGMLNLYWHGDLIMAGLIDDSPMSKEQEEEASELLDLFMAEFEGRA